MRWVMVVSVDAPEPEVRDLAQDLKQRFGERVRTRTVQGWLYDAEHNPEPEPDPGPPSHPFYGVTARDLGRDRR